MRPHTQFATTNGRTAAAPPSPTRATTRRRQTSAEPPPVLGLRRPSWPCLASARGGGGGDEGGGAEGGEAGGGAMSNHSQEHTPQLSVVRSDASDAGDGGRHTASVDDADIQAPAEAAPVDVDDIDKDDNGGGFSEGRRREGARRRRASANTTGTSRDNDGGKSPLARKPLRRLRRTASNIPGRWQVVPDADNNASLWALAVTEHLWAVSTVMLMSVLPIYLSETLGMSSLGIGVLEACAVFATLISKIMSGVVSDLLYSRTAVILVGGTLAVCVKPMIAASSLVHGAFGASACLWWVSTGRILDRLGKGIRAAPTDALLADLSPKQWRGRAYSLKQSLVTLGGVTGSILTTLCMAITKSYTACFLLASIPAAMALLLLYLVVSKPDRTRQKRMIAKGKAERATAEATEAAEAAAAALGRSLDIDDPPPPLPPPPPPAAASSSSTTSGGEASGTVAADSAHVADRPRRGMKRLMLFLRSLKKAASLPMQFWLIATVISVLYLARFSESFVILRAKSVGWPVALLPMLLTGNQLMQALLTYPIGALADRTSRESVLMFGIIFLVLANAIFVAFPSPLGVFVGSLVTGIHMSMTHAIAKTLLSESVEVEQLGTAFSIYAVLSGVTLAVGNGLAGYLNDFTVSRGYGVVGCFWGGAAASVLSLLLLQGYMLVKDNAAARQWPFRRYRSRATALRKNLRWNQWSE
ncbi:MFS general substrate transporter [Pseudoscourfieldia marina]